MEKNFLTNSMNLAKEIAIKKLQEGDMAVDATMGNGNDTVFLAELVGDSGTVYSFDVQKEAIDNTRKKIIDNKIKTNIQLIHDGHENIDKYINKDVKLVMFNLGYLPKAEHKITTKSDTTLIAIKKSLNLIHKNGVVLVVIYHGHENGKLEKVAVEEFASTLNQKEYNVMKLKFINQVNNPPILIAIEKR
ncbi:methyltransferase [Clostridium botulinum C]|uniref:Methyltransferase n=1 Tax=Clostridium botulinum C TaxID=36828 RepID=A0A9Q3VBG5_CLOBO|nr:class I SAM-dependent methyltransferase [Clostridium botulinum]EGO88483.1 SAM-dependent methyltransferase [Clostridium botulinum C str. Stockholm]MCD3195634.1 methyltransferase [Clostridium botulinum C]MCD3201049.1 methyltransferase [Clostridium botulinum C]MCD3206458.1 methyltransferase [Clostridium botulinum C]MCD3208984.1 methyltransferase [Clostridium botulinum C]